MAAITPQQMTDFLRTKSNCVDVTAKRKQDVATVMKERAAQLAASSSRSSIKCPPKLQDYTEEEEDVVGLEQAITASMVSSIKKHMTEQEQIDAAIKASMNPKQHIFKNSIKSIASSKAWDTPKKGTAKNWTYKGKKCIRDWENNVWEFDEKKEDYYGKWIGVYLPLQDKFDISPVDPYIEEDLDVEEADADDEDDFKRRTIDLQKREMELSRREQEIEQRAQQKIAEIEQRFREEQRVHAMEQQLHDLQSQLQERYKTTVESIMSKQNAVRYAILEQLIKEGHIILAISNIKICNLQIQSPMILTTTGVYVVMPHKEKSTFSSDSFVDMLCPIYTFSAPLNLKQTQLISNMLYINVEQYEQVIHYIPGSYSNGAWKQLNGFFGVYLNEDTMELSSIPPPM